MDKDFIDIYNKVSNEKYNAETKNDLNFNLEIKNIGEVKKDETNFEKWMKNYNLAESYYKHHGHLNIHCSFKTTNGYEYDEEGINLGDWISTQRRAYKGQVKNKLTEEQIEIPNRLKSYLNTLDENKSYFKKEINSGFVKKLSK